MKIPVPQSFVAEASPYKKSVPLSQIARQAGIELAEVACLASNENPNNPSPLAIKAIANMQVYNRYPDGTELIEAIAKYHAVMPENVILGNGSNDVLDLIARTYLGTGSHAVASQYGFAIYQLLTQLTGAKNIVVPANNFGHDLTAMARAITQQTKVIWIANPNNPTGTFVPWHKVKYFLNNVPSSVIVVLDQAYYEYLDEANTMPTTDWLTEHPNLVITRTFSKAYGLASLRIGYGLAGTQIIDLLNRVRQPFNVNSVAIAAALAALKDQEFVAQTAAQNMADKADLEADLSSLGVNFVPSFGNFVLAEFADANATNEGLQQAGVLVRPVKEYGLPNHLRITVGTPLQNKKLIGTLKKFLENN